MSSLVALSRLFRLPLAAMVAFSALTAALAANPLLDWLILWSVSWGVLLLTASGSVLNQLQERVTDALMSRTWHRPLACGLLPPRAGMVIGLTTGSAGLVMLFVGCGPLSALLGLAALGWYLLLYTPLKRVSPLAVIAGTPCGILPLLIGWQAAGGSLNSPRILALGLIMLLWQVPHYWLLVLPDRLELEMAGFRVLPRTGDQKLLHICHFWLMSLACATLLLPLLGLLRTPLLQGLLLGVAVSFALWASLLQRRTLFIEKTASKLKLGLHLFLGLVLGLAFLEAVLTRFAI